MSASIECEVARSGHVIVRLFKSSAIRILQYCEQHFHTSLGLIPTRMARHLMSLAWGRGLSVGPLIIR